MNNVTLLAASSPNQCRAVMPTGNEYLIDSLHQVHNFKFGKNEATEDFALNDQPPVIHILVPCSYRYASLCSSFSPER